jgi:hypothetical protein
MDNRPGSGSNGRGNRSGKAHLYGESSRPSIDTSPNFERRWRHIPRAASRRSLPLLPVAILCMAIGLAVGITTLKDSNLPNLQPSPAQADAFRWAVNRAMSAAEITQTAEAKDEWLTVVDWWKEAIRLMESVPRSHPNRKVAEEKAQEYQKNLAYAKHQSQSETREIASKHLWTKGSRRVDILRIQGKPTQAVRYDALCQEVLTYGSSTVELNNGIVVNYEDIDRNLKTAKDNMLTASPVIDGASWTLGSSKEDVFSVQGTPARVVRYDAPSKEILHYGNSAVEVTNGRVTGYSNASGNLRVAVTPLPGTRQQGFWALGSDRNDIFNVQGTPTEVSLDNSLCHEALKYGNSVVDLQNGAVAGYDNLSGNLSVRVK